MSRSLELRERLLEDTDLERRLPNMVGAIQMKKHRADSPERGESMSKDLGHEAAGHLLAATGQRAFWSGTFRTGSGIGLTEVERGAWTPAVCTVEQGQFGLLKGF